MATAPINPNVITTLRLPLAPIAVAFLYTQTLWGMIVAASLAVVLEITDIADGFIARRYNIESDFGKLYDPFSDAFCRYTLFMGIYAIDIASLWMVLALFYRDSSISFLRTIAATRGIVIAARWSGKLKAWVQGVGTQIIFIILILGQLEVMSTAAAWWVMLVVTLVTLYSFFDYYAGNWFVIRESWTQKVST